MSEITAESELVVASELTAAATIAGATPFAGSLDQRIAAALADDTLTSEALAKLVREADRAADAACDAAEKEYERSLDPACADPEKAQATLRKIEFGLDRLEAALPSLYRKSDSGIMVMKSAEDGRRYDAAHVLDGAMDRSIFAKRSMSPQRINKWASRPSGVISKSAEKPKSSHYYPKLPKLQTATMPRLRPITAVT